MYINIVPVMFFFMMMILCLYKAQEPFGVEIYRVIGKVYVDIWGNLEQVKIGVIREASPWESVLQSSRSREEAAQVELITH